ncbi:hypothetical protein BZA05DRAFT_200770 [Tricharina praecox]|uniref:uncharacterized protein n=1 Tax=Tricharina praecox TaxID=43433 RepID=UPI00221F5A84|nr:uncharacterized protein BZA05DRAFT_200770 [Tricharina praecox]KAI5856438.1 hypothetical protein BZA05DRAFT_200770 [Tricharina praecox]
MLRFFLFFLHSHRWTDRVTYHSFIYIPFLFFLFFLHRLLCSTFLFCRFCRFWLYFSWTGFAGLAGLAGVGRWTLLTLLLKAGRIVIQLDEIPTYIFHCRER